jgi:hypothetical protein
MIRRGVLALKVEGGSAAGSSISVRNVSGDRRPIRHHDATLQEHGAKLIDHGRSLADEAGPARRPDRRSSGPSPRAGRTGAT